MRAFSRGVAGLAAAMLLPGCFPYLRTDSPAVSGQVFDARSHRPVAGVRVSTREDERVIAETRTARDGSFELPARTRPDVYLPGQDPPPPPRLVVDDAGRGPRALTVDHEPTWMPLDNALRAQPPSEGGFRFPRGR